MAQDFAAKKKPLRASAIRVKRHKLRSVLAVALAVVIDDGALFVVLLHPPSAPPS
jgi:hypothetical protein